MRFPCPGLFVVFVGAVSPIWAQSSVPTVTQTISTQSLVMAGPSVTLDLRNFITVPGVSATSEVVQFVTYAGRFNVELRRDAAPRHVENFLTYVRAGDYGNSFFHRAAILEAGGGVSILQGGGFRITGENVTEIPRRSPVPLEYNLANARGTLAAARTTDVNSATSEWYFNVRDNSGILNQANGGGYTVFGRVLGSGMTVVDQISQLPRANVSPFSDLPLRNFSGGTIVPSTHLATVNSVSVVTLFPTGGGPSAVDFSVQNSAPSIVSTTLSGSTLTLAPGSGGTATITIRAVDTNGNAAQTSFTVDVAAVQPSFITHPISQTVAAGSTVVLRATGHAVAGYQWIRVYPNREEQILNATNSTLVLRNVTAADAGVYKNTAVNNFGLVPSELATVNVVSLSETSVGRLGNLSVLTSAGAGGRALTMGASVGPLPPNPAAVIPLVVRAVGPTLGSDPFRVPGVLADPVLTFHAVGVEQPIGGNDDWGGGADLAAAFGSVGAFALPAGSLDAAVRAPGLAAGGYTVQVTGKSTAQGMVLAEIYDAAAGTRTASTPRLANLSVLKQLDAGEAMTAGFVIQGESARTVLVRAIGPGLAPFGVPERMADPKLILFRGQARVAENDNWAGDLDLRNVAASVGAFPVENAASGDAMLMLSLPPGDYSAQVADAGGGAGSVIIEVYEVR